MTNFLQETNEIILKSGHKWDDVIFIGSEEGYSCSINEFKQLANFEYDSEFGSQIIAEDLIIVFSDGAKMWRSEYDGSEWWEFSTPFFIEPKNKKIIKSFGSSGTMWQTLGEINEEL